MKLITPAIRKATPKLYANEGKPLSEHHHCQVLHAMGGMDLVHD
jgi:hypothetical protein